MYVVAPVSSAIAVTLFDAWSASRRDKKAQAARSAELARTFGLPPMSGTAADVAAADYRRSALIGIIITVSREDVGIPAGSIYETQILDVFIRAMRRQTHASWWLALSATSPAMDLMATLTPAEKAEFEGIVGGLSSRPPVGSSQSDPSASAKRERLRAEAQLAIALGQIGRANDLLDQVDAMDGNY